MSSKIRRLVEDINKIMFFKENIRNFCICSHVDHGKCVSGDSKVYVNGQWKQASVLFESLKQSPIIFSGENKTVLDVSSKGLRTISLDVSSGCILWKPITYIWRLKYDSNLIEVSLGNGRKVKVTPEHKFLVLNGNKIVEKNAKNLKKGDYIVVPNTLHVTSNGSDFISKTMPLNSEDICFEKVVSKSLVFENYVYDFTVPDTHNLVVEGFFVHNTTLADNLLVAAGLLSPNVAGKALALDYLEEEQKRGITIKTAIISLLHKIDNKSYILNLIDTPGHIDFSGKVTRALRIIDGAVVVVDAVEGIMVQTEIVTQQALNERVKPVLFINKLDRLIRELKLSPKEIQNRLSSIISDFNGLIDSYAEPEFIKSWKVKTAAGSVAFGSALHRWGFTLPIAKEKGVKFSDIIRFYEQNNGFLKLSTLLPLHSAVLDMIVNHLPSPTEAQAYRIPKIWHGDLSTEIGQAMLKCDSSSPLIIVINHSYVDPLVKSVICTGRIFSGSVHVGDKVFILSKKKRKRVHQVSMFMGENRIVVDEVSTGNIVALMGLEEARPGDTVCDLSIADSMVPFELIKYVSEPVVTVAIEPLKPKDLPQMIEIMEKDLVIEDPNLKVSINKETGEYLLSGIGELHLEIAAKKIIENGIDVSISPPIVSFRESISQKTPHPIVVKSPNSYNEMSLIVEPLEEKIVDLIINAGINGSFTEKESPKLVGEFSDKTSLDLRKILGLSATGNILLLDFESSQLLSDVKDSLVSGFLHACNSGPLCEEPLRGIKFLVKNLNYADVIQKRGSEIVHMVKNAIWDAILSSGPSLLEPIYKITILMTRDFIGKAKHVLSKRRGTIHSIEEKPPVFIITGFIPVADTFNLASELRSETSGTALWQMKLDHWNFVPKNKLKNLILGIRQRKGLYTTFPETTIFPDNME